MNDASVKITGGAASTTLDGGFYVSDWAMDVKFPGDENFYTASVLNLGEAGTSAGETDRFLAWSLDPDTLLSLRKEGEVDGKWKEEPLPVEDAVKLRGVLQAVIEGRQPVVNNLGLPFPAARRDEIVTFLEPRIVVGAQNLRENGTVRVGDIDAKLDEGREGREEPPMPLI